MVTQAAILIFLLAFVQETLIILYSRGVIGGNVFVVMLATTILALLGYYGMTLVLHDEQLMLPATIGHTLAVPLAMKIPLPKKDR